MTNKKEIYDPKQIEHIERLEIMEEKFGICFEGINATIELCWTGSTTIIVQAEMHALNSTGIIDNLEIFLVGYSSDGKVLGKGSQQIIAENFFALCPIYIYFYLHDWQDPPAKYRLYPNKTT